MDLYYNIYYGYRVPLYCIVLYYIILKKVTGMTYLPAMGHVHISLAYNSLACRLVQFVMVNDF